MATITTHSNDPAELSAALAGLGGTLDTHVDHLREAFAPILDEMFSATPTVTDTRIDFTWFTGYSEGQGSLFGENLTNLNSGISITVSQMEIWAYVYPTATYLSYTASGAMVFSREAPSGYLRSVSYSDGETTVAFSGNMPLNDGPLTLSSLSISITNDDGSVTRFSFSGNILGDGNGNFSGTVTAVSVFLDSDGAGGASPTPIFSASGISIPAATFMETEDYVSAFLQLTSGNDVINGTSQSDTLFGHAGNDTLDGKAGGDTLAGGIGNDTYIIDAVSDLIIENPDEGVDLARIAITTAGASYTLGDNVENATLINSVAFDLVGSAVANTLIGNAATNTLDGDAGDDFLDGKGGADVLFGGVGDDTYVVDHTGDEIIENPGEGTDLVRITIATANATHTLAENVENAILLNSVAFNLVGNSGNNTLTGNAAANTLDGGAGDDFLVGGLGNDTYVLDSLGDSISDSGGSDTVVTSLDYSLAAGLEHLTLTGNGLTGQGNALANTLKSLAGDATLIGGLGNDSYFIGTGDSVVDSGGIDTVVSSADHSLGADFEHLTLTGAAVSATGNTLANTLIGNGLANTLDGGLGVDLLKGGAGDDTYVVDLTATNLLQDVLSENNGEGSDTVILRGGNTGLASTVTLTLGNHLDHLDASATGLTKLNLNGNTLNNTLIGNAAANTLDGKAGADVLEGGAGDDIYVLDSLADLVVENPGEGTDLVRITIATANATHTLAENVENAILLNSVAFNLLGNSGNNTLTGNGLANTLDGGAGDDFLVGGLGNDTYVLDSLGDSISDSGGSDTVVTSLDYSLAAGLEHLTLTGNGLTGQGNALANTLKSLAGDATLIGGLGNDSYFIGTGDSVVDSGGIDTVVSSVDHSLGADFEHLTLTGAAVSATGNTLANTLIGNGLANTLDGGLGVDLLKGGAGDDSYVVDLTATNLLQDVLSENSGEGSDTVILRGGNTGLASTVTLTLGNHLDHLDGSATGSTKLNLNGNTLNNTLIGNAAANTLDGKAGADVLEGGAGDDTYVLDHLADLVVENPGEGTDLVRITIATANATHTLAENVENAILLNSVAFNLLGNSGNNTLTGNAAANTLDGGAGDDFLVGGLGNDTYVLDSLGDSISDSGGSDTVVTSLDYSLAAGLEHLTLTGNGLTGQGNALANTLKSLAGDATLIGGLGNDSYFIGTGDSVVDSGGIDTVVSSVDHSLGADFEHLTLTGAAVSATGNTLANTLIGNGLANTLDGGLGVDLLKGGAGDDSYVVDLTATNLLQDVLSENSGEGSDTVILRGGNTGLASTVTLTLGNHLDHLDGSATGSTKLNLNGNTLNNTLIGNDAANTLDGKAGADVLEGGAGDDTYVLDSLADLVVENPGEGTDLVRITIATANATHTLAENVENAILLNSVAFNLVGNGLNNTLTGNGLANTLDGGAGDDFLVGGLGNDTYVLDSLGDSLSDSGGSDTVVTSLDYSLAASLEHLTLTGNGDIDGRGNAQANSLTGNDGINVLDGGLGNDLLRGGAGNDDFVFSSALNGTSNVDKLLDFSSGDRIVLDDAIFAALAGGVADAHLRVGAGAKTATMAEHHLMYDSTSGGLYYDPDGVGGSGATLFAYVFDGLTTNSHPTTLAAADFTLL